jgi:C-terminal processing protease CtpA/Prc
MKARKPRWTTEMPPAKNREESMRIRTRKDLTFLVLGLLAAAFPLEAVEARSPWTGAPEQKIMGLMTVWAEAKFNFPYFDRIPDVDWDAKAGEFISRALSAEGLEAYYDVLMEFAALLKDGHTRVLPPWMLAKPGHDIPPLELQALGGGFYVARTGDTEEIRTQGIRPGLQVLEIEEIPARTYLNERVLRFGRWGSPQADEALGLMGVLSGPKDSRVTLKVQGPDGPARLVSLNRNSADRDGRPFVWRFMRWYMFDPLIETRMIEPGICYIRISNFGSKAAEEFLKVFDGLDFSGLKGIILDLRHNPGGDSDQAYAVIGCLTDRPLQGSKWKSLCYVPAFRSWGQPTGWKEDGPAVIEPRAGRRFSGPLAVLTGPGTFSAAEDFLVPLQYAKRAVLVGEKTAGSTGNPIRVPLPGGGTFMVVSKRDTFPDGREFVGIGIQPDVEVHPTPKDLLEGTDSVLGKAVDVIKNWGFYRRQ